MDELEFTTDDKLDEYLADTKRDAQAGIEALPGQVRVLLAIIEAQAKVVEAAREAARWSYFKPEIRHMENAVKAHDARVKEVLDGE